MIYKKEGPGGAGPFAMAILSGSEVALDAPHDAPDIVLLVVVVVVAGHRFAAVAVAVDVVVGDFRTHDQAGHRRPDERRLGTPELVAVVVIIIVIVVAVDVGV